MASRTLRRDSSLTRLFPLITADTVPFETCARRATSRMVAKAVRLGMIGRSVVDCRAGQCAACPIAGQKAYLRPNCTILGSLALTILPKVAADRFVFGLPRFTWLKALKASARNSSV